MMMSKVRAVEKSQGNILFPALRDVVTHAQMLKRWSGPSQAMQITHGILKIDLSMEAILLNLTYISHEQNIEDIYEDTFKSSEDILVLR